MDQGSKRLYIRYLSNVVRKWSPSSSINNMTENPVFPVDGMNRAIIVTICRIRQRILTQAWAVFIKNTGVKHNYEQDARMILYRRIPDSELRTELEIEVLYKWVIQVKDLDPTGIANTIFMCKRKAVVYAALQQLRLEFYEAGETVLFEGDIPRPEDGHFTVFKGECEVLQFPDESVPLMKLLYLAKKRRWDDAKLLLNTAPIVARIPKLSGFGELSTLTGVKRAASIRISPKVTEPAEILILPKEALLDCLKSRTNDDVEGAATSEAIDFLRQSGLANRISPKDLVSAASSMIRRTLVEGEILYYKGETAKSIYLVVSGEFLLDTGDFMVNNQPAPFVRATNDRCYHLTAGSILGEEGVVGDNNVYVSTAAVVSSAAVVFEAVSFGMNFLAEKVGGLRYSALYYRDKLCWDFAQPIAEQNNPYTFFNSLRKSISHMKPYRGLESLAAAACAEHRIQEQAKKLHSAKQMEIKKQRLKNSRGGILPTAAMISSISGGDMLNKSSEPENPFLSYPRTLSGVGLHRAIEINKHVKKILMNISRSHAKESILFEQLNRIPDEEKFDDEMLHVEQLFELNLKEYYERCAVQARRMKEEEETRRRNAATRASSAIKFFSTNSSGFVEQESAGETNTNSVVDTEANQNSLTLEVAREEAVREANKATTPTNLRRNRDSLVNDMNMAKLYSMDTNLDPTMLHANKLELYYQWVDSLTLMGHKHLIQQAEQTAEELHDLLYHDHSTHFLLGKSLDQALSSNTMSEEERWAELGKIFYQYGLTPMDMTAEWMGKGNDSDDIKPTIQPTAAPGKRSILVAKEDMLPKPTDSLPVASKKTSIAESKAGKSIKPDASKAKGAVSKDSSNAAAQSTSVTKKEVSYAAKEHEEKLIKAHLDSKYKSYTPSSWRDDMIQKKSQETTVAHVFHFLRSSTPDNRKIVSFHVIPPNRDASGPQYANLQQQPGTKPVNQSTVLSSGVEQLDNAQAHSKGSEIPSLVDYAQFIDEPDYFMTALRENPLTHIQRIKRGLDPWDTRFMNVRNPKRNSAGAELNKADEDAAALKIIDKVTLPQIVRTHLKENLQKYSRNEILAAAQTQLDHSETHFMRVIFGKELDTYQPSKSARSSWSVSRNASFIQEDGQNGGIRRRQRSNPLKAAIDAAIAAVDGDLSIQSSSSPSLQEVMGYKQQGQFSPPPQQPFHKQQDGQHSPSMISIATSDKEYEADILRSLPTLGDAHFSSTLRAPNSDHLNYHSLQGEPSVLTLPSVAEGDIEISSLQEKFFHQNSDKSIDMHSTAGSSIAEESDRDDASSIAGDDVGDLSRRPSQDSVVAEGRVTFKNQENMGDAPLHHPVVDSFGSHAADHAMGAHKEESGGADTSNPDLTVIGGNEPLGTMVSNPHVSLSASNTSTNEVMLQHENVGGEISSPISMGRRGRKKVAVQKVYIRYTDTKPSSSALEEFEGFMKSQDPQFMKAKAEGRKRANQKCKYRLAPSLRGDPELLAAAIAQQQKGIPAEATDDNMNTTSNGITHEDMNTTLGKDIHLRPKVSLKRIIMERLKSEIAVFQAMYPKATMVQRRNFIESFQSKFPQSEINVQDYEEAANALTGGIGNNFYGSGYQSPPSGSYSPPIPVFDFEKKTVPVNDNVPISMMTLAKKMMVNSEPGSRIGSPPGNIGRTNSSGMSPPRSPGRLLSRSRDPSRPGTSSESGLMFPPKSPKPKFGSMLRSSSTFMLDVAESAVTFLEDQAVDSTPKVTNILTIGDEAHGIGDILETHSLVSKDSNTTSSILTPAQRKIDAAKTRRKHSLLMDATQAMLQMKEEELLQNYDVEIEHDNAHIEDWQRYTIQCIVKEKSGERKILPSIATKKTIESLALTGKHYRSDAASGYNLISLPSKQSEEPIQGPTSYLELYRTSFHLPTSRRLKEKIQRELKATAKKMNM